MPPSRGVLPELNLDVFRPFLAFAAHKTSGGILLIACTALALAWANSPWAGSYAALWHTNFSVSLAGSALSHDLHFWVNDLLMAVFFFVVGLEIKREILVGELASPSQRVLPVLAALGGVVVPALLYSVLNAGGTGAAGWGIPMATDIAFALGVMSILGEKVPLGLKVLLTAIAIVDDIAAVLVIAVFYTARIEWTALAVAGILIALLLGTNFLRVRHPLPYAALGAMLWLAMLHSGIHATIAGVLLAFTIPARTTLRPDDFLARGRTILNHFESAAGSAKTLLHDEEQQAALKALEEACEQVQSALHRMERALHPWVTFLIMPVFALANAGVAIPGNVAQTLTQPVTIGVILGLVLGKPAGILFTCWIAVRARWASLPAGVSWRHIHGAGWLGGIGFTMSLFVAGLAFGDGPLLTAAKLAILLASMCAGGVGALLLLKTPEAGRQ